MQTIPGPKFEESEAVATIPETNGVYRVPEVVLPSVVIELPIEEIGRDAYRSRRVDVNLTGAQADNLRRIFNGLYKAGAKLENGKPVSTPSDAVRYMLEQVSA